MTREQQGMTFDLSLKVQRAVALYQSHAPKDGAPYHGAFSGGKDSVVIKRLAELAGVHVVWHYSITTIDPPELVWFIKEHHKDVVMVPPRYGNLALHVGRRGFPTRRARWCCAKYKESNPRGVIVVTGVRIAESAARKARYTACSAEPAKGRPAQLFPIRLWSDDDVWGFINHYQVPYCSLYDEGFDRLGCIGCPLAKQSNREMEFRRWPRIEALWRRGFYRLWERKTRQHAEDGTVWNIARAFDSAEELFLNWRNGARWPNLSQLRLPLEEETLAVALEDVTLSRPEVMEWLGKAARLFKMEVEWEIASKGYMEQRRPTPAPPLSLGHAPSASQRYAPSPCGGRALRHGKMEEALAYRSTDLDLVLYREEAWPYGCKRVFVAVMWRNGMEVRGKPSHRRQDCIDWLTRAARLFGHERAWLELAASVVHQRKQEPSPLFSE